MVIAKSIPSKTKQQSLWIYITFSDLAFRVNFIRCRRRRVNRYGVDVVWVKSSPIITPSVILLNSKLCSLVSIRRSNRMPQCICHRQSSNAKNREEKKFYFLGRSQRRPERRGVEKVSEANTEPKIFTTVLVRNSDFLDFPLFLSHRFPATGAVVNGFYVRPKTCKLEFGEFKGTNVRGPGHIDVQELKANSTNTQKVYFMQNECCFATCA